MTASLHGTSYPMGVIPHSSTTGGNPARAEILQTQAGRARHLYELLAGAGVADVPACAPSPAHAPMGTPGHDHSGGVFGVPIVRTLYSAVFGANDTYLGVNVLGGRAPQMDLAAADIAGSPRFIFQGDLKTLWIPGCAPDGCYIDALLTLQMYASASADLEMSWSSGGHTISASASTGDPEMPISASGHYVWSLPQRIALYPGRIGVATLKLWMVGTALIGPTVSLLAIGVHQTKSTP